MPSTLLNTVLASSVLLPLAACGTTDNDYPRMPSGSPVSQLAGPTIVAGSGIVQAIELVSRDKLDADVGTRASVVLSNVLGHRIGPNRTDVDGAAPAGRDIEQISPRGNIYRISLLMDDGTIQAFALKVQPNLQVGKRVRVVNGSIVQAS